MTVDYRQMLSQLLAERDTWMRRRDEAAGQISKIGALIRATVRMLPPQQASLGERVLEEIDERPLGLTEGLRLCLMTETDEWQSPMQLREALKNLGFSFEAYRANPLASIHTTLKRMADDLEVKGGEGQRVYRLKGTRIGSGPPLAVALRGRKVRVVASSFRDMLELIKKPRRSGGDHDGSSRES